MGEGTVQGGATSPLIPGVTRLRPVGQDGLGRIFAGSIEGAQRAVLVRLLERPLAADELLKLSAQPFASPPDEGLAAIIDAGLTADSRTYVVIDAASSTSLAERRASGDWLSQDEAVELVIAACDALAALHDQGCVYGTITPESVARTAARWRLIDPGIAAAAIPLPPPADAAIEGVLAYTAPEVIDGSPCSPASDIFGLAATVVELVTGRAVGARGDRVAAPPQEPALSPDAVPLPEELWRCLQAALDPSPSRRPDAVTLRGWASGPVVEASPQLNSTPEKPPSPHSEVLDDDVQFTVYRPHSVQPGRWYSLLAFAHKSEPFVDEMLGPIDPLEEMRSQASSRLGADFGRYGTASDDSSQQLPRGSSLTFVPQVDGVEFNPPNRAFLWMEPVHEEEFRMRAEPRLDGQRARGRLSVYFGSILIAEVSLSFRVSSGEDNAAVGREESRPYRKIFISYSHHDRAVVEQVETFLSVVGDEFLRDTRDLRAGEVWEERLADMIRAADVFQLFWSTNSMRSPFVRREWTYALGLKRPSFIRPTYWENPMPEIPDQNLPPDELRRLHFRYLPAAIGEHAATPAVEPSPAASPPADEPATLPSARPGTQAKPRRRTTGRLAMICTALAGSFALALLVVSSTLQGSGNQTAASKSDFDRSATLIDRGHRVQVGGPIACPSGDTVQLRATVSQATTGAVASGSWLGRCTGRSRHWKTIASVTYGPSFTVGCGRGAGVAVIRRADQAVMRVTWQNALKLTDSYGAGTAAGGGC